MQQAQNRITQIQGQIWTVPLFLRFVRLYRNFKMGLGYTKGVSIGNLRHPSSKKHTISFFIQAKLPMSRVYKWKKMSQSVFPLFGAFFFKTCESRFLNCGSCKKTCAKKAGPCSLFIFKPRNLYIIAETGMAR